MLFFMNRIPKNIGIIPDGNRRWAKLHGFNKEDGYDYGLEPGLMLLRITRDISRIDLVIRWGGMRRLSGLLPLQTVYADICVIDDLWPDFTDEQFINVLKWYSKQDVTLGG